VHRHHSISNEVIEVLTQCHHQPRREQRIADNRRPGDVYVPHWKKGLPLAMDFAVTHPLQPSASAKFADVVTSGSWAAAYSKKHKSPLAASCEAHGVMFSPMVVETFGSWDPEALDVLFAIGRQFATHQGLDVGYANKVLFTNLSVTLQRQNVRAILARSMGSFQFEHGTVSDAPNQLELFNVAQNDEEWSEVDWAEGLGQ
jgi:hypothetical protein